MFRRIWFLFLLGKKRTTVCKTTTQRRIVKYGTSASGGDTLNRWWKIEFANWTQKTDGKKKDISDSYKGFIFIFYSVLCCICETYNAYFPRDRETNRVVPRRAIRHALLIYSRKIHFGFAQKALFYCCVFSIHN